MSNYSANPSRKKEWELTQEAFDRLLSWLDAKPEEGGKKYEVIRARLVKILTCRGCTTPEDLADDTINRVAKRVPEIAATYTGNPAIYFYGVAHKVVLEHFRKKPDPLPTPTPEPSQEIERELECLDQCMQQLPSKNRELILQYYQEEKHAKIDCRKALAEKLGVAMNALRILAHRIRTNLQQCVLECLKQNVSGEMD